MSKITVVTGARPVALDSGRQLNPGESAVVEDSERHLELITDGHLTLVIPVESESFQEPVSARKRTSKED